MLPAIASRETIGGIRNMGLLGRWLRKLKSKVSVIPRKEEDSKALRITLEKAKKYGGDPFYEYREKKILPEKFEYGMNCYLNTTFDLYGEETAQKAYEEIRKKHAYIILEYTPGGDIALFAVPLKTAMEAENKAIKAIEAEKQARVLESEPFLVNLHMALRFWNEIIKDKAKELLEKGEEKEAKRIVEEDVFVILRINLEKFEKYSEKLLNRCIFCKSKVKNYYDFLIFQELRNGYAYGKGGRHVQLSEPEIIVQIPKSDQKKYFNEEKELSEEETKSINLVYMYYKGRPVFGDGKNLAAVEDEMVVILKDGTEVRDDAKMHFDIGNIYLEQELLNLAVEEYEEALKLFPTFTPVLNNLGIAYIKLGKYEKAIECYRQFVSLTSSEWDNIGQVEKLIRELCRLKFKNALKSCGVGRGLQLEL